MTNSNSKGKRGEREAASEWRRLFGTDVRRSQQYCGRSDEADDLVGQEGFAMEVKRVEALNLPKALSKAAKEAAEDKIPIVLHKRNRGRWIASVYLDDLPEAAVKLFHTLCEKATE